MPWGGLFVTTALAFSVARAELELLEQCGRESDVCLSHSRLRSHLESVRLSADGAGTTIVLNHWQRPAQNLRGQLHAAVASSAVEVWVCIFGSPHQQDYLDVVEELRTELPEAGRKIRVVQSDVDFGVYGRFLLASSAKTHYAYIVDDDVEFPVTIIEQYQKRMMHQPAVWGHAGHVRNNDPEKARWVIRPRKPTEVDYANAAWFLKTAWIAGAFLAEPPHSRLTGEDMHLSHMVRKVFAIDTRVVGWQRDGHPRSRYRLEMTDKTTVTPAMFALRSHIAKAQLARGPTTRQMPRLDALAWADTADQARSLLRDLEGCAQSGRPAACRLRGQSMAERGTFRVALAFSGLQQGQERGALEDAARRLCLRFSEPRCAFAPQEYCGTACGELKAAEVAFFDLQVGRGAVAPMRARLAADALESAAGLLSAQRCHWLLLPAEASLMRRMVLQAVEILKEERGRRVPEVVEYATG